MTDSGFSPQGFPAALPCGVCATSDWRLFEANHPLGRLLGISGKDVKPDALEKWLANGELRQVSSNPGHGSFIFANSSSQAWLLYWWRSDNPEAPFDRRFFCLHELPYPAHAEYNLQNHLELEKILDFIHDGIWVIDGNGITLRINRAMERIAGIRAEEVVGRHVSEPLKEGRFKTCVTLNALQNRHTVTLFDDYANGKRCLNTSTPVFDSNGKVWRVIAAIRDITELDELQTRLSSLEVEAMAYRLRAQGLENTTHGALIGQSQSIQRALQDITRASHTDAITLIMGETGTGKSLAAKIIHELSTRSQRPFVQVNCGAIAPSLMESELFGYEKGAFTGASKNGKPGMLELAAGGTLLLDEIGELSMPMQAKLLHVLDGQPIYRVGGIHPIKMTARILAATNRHLDKMAAEGKFRQDLYYRLRVLCVEMPPLRDRKDDILLLAWHFLRKICNEVPLKKQLDSQVERLFLAYAWPGNVRELQSVIQSLATLCESVRITPDDLPSYMRQTVPGHALTPSRRLSLSSAVEELEKKMIHQALTECGSTYKAARRLGISQSSVARKAKKYGIPQQLWNKGRADFM